MIVHFETLGCKLNQIESESACKSFSDFGFEITTSPATASEKYSQKEIEDTLICIVNTCTVTAKAEQKCRRVINLLLKTFVNSSVIVTGCYAEVEKEFISKMNPRIVVIPGTQKDILTKIPQLIKSEIEKNPELKELSLANFIKANLISENLKFLPQDRFKLSTDTFFNHSRSSIKIQDGCANSCTFCRIHIARGNPVSLDANEVLQRVQNLENSGQMEVVLTGVNLSQYRSKLGEKTIDFADLLEYLNDNTTKINFRISSLYPERVDEELERVLRKSRVRPHFHLSVQSGSDRILDLMNRPYKAIQIEQAVNRLRNIYKNPFIACDIIAGFPGESEEDFEMTMELCAKCNFTWIHAFPFSPRPGTKAYTMKPIIPQYIVKKRIEKLTNLAENNKNLYIKNFEDVTVKAIVEKRQDKLVRCVTENFLHCELILPQDIDSKSLGGKEIYVTIKGASEVPECECKCVYNS